MRFPIKILEETRAMIYMSLRDHTALARMTSSEPVKRPIRKEEPITEEDHKALCRFAKELGTAVKASMRRRGTLTK